MTRYDPRTVRTWAQINVAALSANVQALTQAVAPDELMAIVKADAYGHGAVPVARVCYQNGVGHFGVATVDEALTLRKAGVRGDIYLLSAFHLPEAEALVRGDIIPMLSSRAHFVAIAAAATNAPLPVRAFLVVDSGMGREGMLPEEARSVWNAAQRGGQNAVLTGIASHLSCADDSEGEGTTATRAQTQAFAAFVRGVAETFPGTDDRRGNAGVWLTAFNSPGTLRQAEWEPIPSDLPGVRGVLHRAGLSLYGIEPFAGAFAALPDLRQTLTWQARIVLIRDLPQGATVGYGRTHTLARPSRIATVACGYGDGYPRRLSNRGMVRLRDQTLPIVGRVSMDQMQVDVSDAAKPAKLGDMVTLLGDGLPVLSFADSIGATAHEPTCYLTNRVPRLYTDIPTVPLPPR